jgi:predicted O-linked N-acetylglucosamine transferase (SPINDLY family)
MSDPKLARFQQVFREQAEALERREREEHQAAIQRYRERLSRDGDDPDVCRKLARHLAESGDHEQGIAVLREGIERCPPSLDLYLACIWALQRNNRTREAIATARRAALQFPDSAAARLTEAVLLPVLYESRAEIDYYRERFAAGVDRFIGGLSLDTPAARASALEAISRQTNFYLAGQGRNDVDLQRRYGLMVHAVMAACYPEWSRPQPMPKLAAGEKIRVGYVSARFFRSSVYRAFFGWIRHHDRDRFEVNSYYVGRDADASTEEVRRHSLRFFHAPGDLEAACRAILADRLHAVVFLDLGMDAIMMQLATLRLAPVQVATWGHPVTSGLPTVDYFLSSELMEPEEGQAHYSEHLVRLPGIGICYEKPPAWEGLRGAMTWMAKSDFGIRADAVAYLCWQSSYKHHPDGDRVIARIAARVESSQFVFHAPNAAVAEDFRRRLDRAFSAEGLRAADRCVLLPEQTEVGYWNLIQVCDICLDTIGSSGCNTTMDAIACRLPVVTTPGEFMRGRQSYGILTQFGVTDTIAPDVDGYIEIAVRLGLDRAWRAGIVERIASRYSTLYSDRRSIVALEKWFRDIVGGQARY